MTPATSGPLATRWHALQSLQPINRAISREALLAGLPSLTAIAPSLFERAAAKAGAGQSYPAPALRYPCFGASGRPDA